MRYLLSLLWIVQTAGTLLFYVYLWQLKEYHVGRFLDYLGTKKGSQLIFSRKNGARLTLFIFGYFAFFLQRQSGGEVFLYIFLFLLILFYFAQDLIFFLNIWKRKNLSPIISKKTAFLILTVGGVSILFLAALLIFSQNVVIFGLWLVSFDILAVFIFSLVILSIQPFVVLWRRTVLKKAAAKREQRKDLLVVGITGSYGKTSVKEFLSFLLEEKFKVLKTKDHQNSEIGIANCVLKELKPKHQIFVAEMGAYGKGGIKLLCDMVKPNMGILTGVNEQHMALFGSQETIVNTKFELIESLPEEGASVLNMQNEFIKTRLNRQGAEFKVKKKIFVSSSEEMDVWARDIKIEKDKIEFNMMSKEGDFCHIQLNLIGGAPNVDNFLLAAAAAKELGVSFASMAKAARKISQDKTPLKLLKGKEGILILDSSYSANPDGVLADLEYLKLYPGRKIFVMPCLIELGKSAEAVHRRLGRKIGEVCDFVVVSTQDYFSQIKQGALETGLEESAIAFVENPEEIARRIDLFAVAGDVIFFEGRVPRELINLFQ